MKASMTIKKWKQAVFEETFTIAGLTYEIFQGNYGNVTLKVETDSLETLGAAVKAANAKIAELS